MYSALFRVWFLCLYGWLPLLVGRARVTVVVAFDFLFLWLVRPGVQAGCNEPEGPRASRDACDPALRLAGRARSTAAGNVEGRESAFFIRVLLCSLLVLTWSFLSQLEYVLVVGRSWFVAVFRYRSCPQHGFVATNARHTRPSKYPLRTNQMTAPQTPQTTYVIDTRFYLLMSTFEIPPNPLRSRTNSNCYPTPSPRHLILPFAILHPPHRQHQKPKTGRHSVLPDVQP